MNQKGEQKMGTESIPKLMVSMAVPSIIAQIINILYNIVDRIYIGHIPGVGAAALTGVGITFPIITLISDDPSLLALASACLPAALLIQAPNYGITVEKARLQATGHSGRTLAVTFAVNLAALLIIWLTARQLSVLYALLGVSYLVTWAVLHFCIKK